MVDALGYRGLFGALAVVGAGATLVLIAFVPETLRGGAAAVPEGEFDRALSLTTFELVSADSIAVRPEGHHADD